MGSKNAAFYLGKRIKVATRQAGGAYVHELGIGASDLEQRYRDGQVCIFPAKFGEFMAGCLGHHDVGMHRAG